MRLRTILCGYEDKTSCFTCVFLLLSKCFINHPAVCSTTTETLLTSHKAKLAQSLNYNHIQGIFKWRLSVISTVANGGVTQYIHTD